MRTLTLSVLIQTELEAVMAYASDPRHLPQWAPGFAHSVTQDGDEWMVQMAEGSVRMWFTPPNAEGILDHVVRIPDGEEVMNTMRASSNGSGCEVSFLLHQRAGMSDAQLAADAALVQADLQRLKTILED